MKKMVLAALITGTLYTGAVASNFDIGLSGDERGITGFSLSIGDYYRVPYREVIMVQRSIPRDEMSVVYLLSRHSRYDAQFIVDLRLRGYSWWDITMRIGLDPRTLYVVESKRYHRPPYGKAYGYHSHRLNDDEIIELSNVLFLSRYHGVSPDEIISRRYKGDKYIVIDNYYRTRHTDNRRFDDWRDHEKHYEKRYEERERVHQRVYDKERERAEKRVYERDRERVKERKEEKVHNRAIEQNDDDRGRNHDR